MSELSRIDPYRIVAHPTRRAILAIFNSDRDLEASAVDLYRHPGMQGLGLETLALTNVNYHCVILQQAGLFEEARTEAVRGAIKRSLRLSTRGREYLDGQGGLLGANLVLDKMAVIVRQVGDGSDLHETENAYEQLVDLIKSTGRDVGGKTSS
jgi:hypothetical protein